MKNLINFLKRYLQITQWLNYKWKNHAKKYINGDLVDIGCGGKQQMYIPLVNSYTAVDYEETYLHAGGIITNSEVDVFASAENLPFKDKTFDCALCYQVLEHLQKPQDAVKEAYRVLKKGGYFIVTIPFTYRIHSAPYDYFRFTEHGIKYLLNNSGFKIVHFESGGGMWMAIGARMAGYIYSDLLKIGYGEYDNKKKAGIRLLFAPFLLPLLVIIIIVCRFFDKIHYIDKDSICYYIIGQK